MEKRMGAETVLLPSRPGIIAGAAFAGKKEKEGPLGNLFDQIVEDDTFGEESWEKAESHFFYSAAKTCLQKAGVIEKSVQYLLGGDLLNQIMASSMAARELGIPFLGLYGACSTMAESLALGSMLVDGGFAKQVICGASSHFCTAERQYRFPLEYGSQRCPTSQWTVTGAGATLLSSDASLNPLAHVTHVTVGRLVDMGVTDANNMGAAMAPAAASTLAAHFQDTGRSAADYDRIVTGDLGRVGHDALLELMEKKGLPLDFDHYMDCGLQIYDANQDVHAGGSGCGCSACVFNTLLLSKLASGEFKRILFMATGALLSPTSNQQGESIPGVAHAVAIESAQA
jgi:stage V sporulation protein AD